MLKILFLFNICISLTCIGQTKPETVETCDCSILGTFPTPNSTPLAFDLDIMYWKDIQIAKGYDFLFGNIYFKTYFTGRCYRNFGDSLYLTLEIDKGHLRTGSIVDSLGTIIWEMVIDKLQIGYIKKWDARTQLFYDIILDTNKVFFTEYNMDSTKVQKYAFNRHDFRRDKVDHCEIYEQGILIASFVVKEHRYNYEVTEYYTDGKIKANGMIRLKRGSMVHHQTRAYENHKFGTWFYFDSTGRKTEKMHQFSFDEIIFGN